MPKIDHHQRDAIRRESRLVELVVDAMGLQDYLSDIYSANERETGYHGRLTFQGFRSVFCDFPYLLTYENLYKLPKHSTLKPRRMFRRPGNSIISTKYNDVLVEHEYEANERPVAMLFPYDRIPGGMVLHNSHSEDLHAHKSAKLIWTETGEPRCIQPLHSLLLHLRNSNWDHLQDTALPKPEINFAIKLMPKIQENAAYRIVTLLWHLARHHNSPDASGLQLDFSVERHSGRKWLKLTRKQISMGTGLSKDQVANGLRRLRSQGFIDVEKLGRINLYRLSKHFYTHLYSKG